ncbi:MAG TPA: carboxypeptidase regulatory-like domain-containing protein [Polyangiaceae bacterium]|jgi:hypothetical protein
MRAIRGAVGFVPLVVLVVVAACGDHVRSGYGSDFADGGGADVGVAPGEAGNLVGNGDASGHPCVRLECQQVACDQPNQAPTTVSGVVFDPAGKNPLYDVIVYIPNDTVQPLTHGVVCDQCGVLASGSPLVTALTGYDGRFVLKNVPVGQNIPLVIQLGKWRKQLVIPQVNACTDNPMSNPSIMRMPAKQSEGDMPQMAVTTGGCDPFECVLHKIGIDPSEFTNETGGGKVHVYQGAGGSALPTATSTAATLWASPTLSTYDVIINSCECSEVPAEKPQSAIDNLVAYANGGGRLFNTHYQYYWIDPTKIVSSPVVSNNPDWQSTATFIPEVDGTTSITGYIDTTFPKGEAFAEWLFAVGGSTAEGQFPIDQARYNVTTANPPSTQWVDNPNTGATSISGQALLHYTFDTPVGLPDAKQCGKVLFSDFHVVASTSPGAPFPEECTTDPLTPQELALEFMLFDLSACIQQDTEPPEPPQPTQ